jgi:tripartite ATP-independent transporter DctM subunit
VFTPTEAAIISSMYALVVGLFIYRGLSLKRIPRILIDSAVSAASIILLVGFANVFGWILTSERIPQTIAAALLGISENKYVVILLMNVLLLIVGTFMETIAALLILLPPLLPIALHVGIDPIHFATFAVLNLMIGLSTPPVGVCLFVAANIGKISLAEISAAVVPFLICNLLILGFVSYIPFLSLWLPSLFYQ